VDGVEYRSEVDGSPTVGTDILGEVRSGANEITFGPGPEHKVSHTLSAPTTKYKVGDTVPVKVLIKNEAGPQLVSSVYTIFGWDTSKLEFMGMDKKGARSSISSSIGWTGEGRVNETSVPKDGNAAHNWLAMLGDKSFIDKENLIVTLNFKVIADFSTTEVKMLANSDPSLLGLTIIDECGVLGSNIPGYSVTGTQSGTVVNGVLP
jgi:hypothetical protein